MLGPFSHILPLIPIATSNGNRAPIRGSRGFPPTSKLTRKDEGHQVTWCGIRPTVLTNGQDPGSRRPSDLPSARRNRRPYAWWDQSTLAQDPCHDGQVKH